jgi:hypothetical protein
MRVSGRQPGPWGRHPGPWESFRRNLPTFRWNLPKLKPCPDCGHQVSRQAYRCPACGRRLRMNMYWQFVLLVLFIWFMSTIGHAHAGSNECEGTVQVGKEWTTIKGELGDYAPDGCRFLSVSRLGRRIIAVCQDGSDCQIDVPLTKRSSTITSVTSVRKQ